MGRAVRTITLEIDPSSGPICGRVYGDDRVQPFSGWLELAAALGAEFDAHAAADADEPRHTKDAAEPTDPSATARPITD